MQGVTANMVFRLKITFYLSFVKSERNFIGKSDSMLCGKRSISTKVVKWSVSHGPRSSNSMFPICLCGYRLHYTPLPMLRDTQSKKSVPRAADHGVAILCFLYAYVVTEYITTP